MKFIHNIKKKKKEFGRHVAFLCVPTLTWLSQTSSDPASHPPILIHIHSFHEYLPNAFGVPRGRGGSAPDDCYLPLLTLFIVLILVVLLTLRAGWEEY